MNKLLGEITNILKEESLMLIDMEVEGYPMSALLTDSPLSSSWLKQGNRVQLVFKETEVSLMKHFSGKISLRNQLPCEVIDLKKGVLLSLVKLQFGSFEITSAITTRSVESLGIIPGEPITALIKANEISIASLQSI